MLYIVGKRANYRELISWWACVLLVFGVLYEIGTYIFIRLIVQNKIFIENSKCFLEHDYMTHNIVCIDIC